MYESIVALPARGYAGLTTLTPLAWGLITLCVAALFYLRGRTVGAIRHRRPDAPDAPKGGSPALHLCCERMPRLGRLLAVAELTGQVRFPRRAFGQAELEGVIFGWKAEWVRVTWRGAWSLVTRVGDGFARPLESDGRRDTDLVRQCQRELGLADECAGCRLARRRQGRAKARETRSAYGPTSNHIDGECAAPPRPANKVPAADPAPREDYW